MLRTASAMAFFILISVCRGSPPEWCGINVGGDDGGGGDDSGGSGR